MYQKPNKQKKQIKLKKLKIRLDFIFTIAPYLLS